MSVKSPSSCSKSCVPVPAPVTIGQGKPGLEKGVPGVLKRLDGGVRLAAARLVVGDMLDLARIALDALELQRGAGRHQLRELHDILGPGHAEAVRADVDHDHHAQRLARPGRRLGQLARMGRVVGYQREVARAWR